MKKTPEMQSGMTFIELLLVMMIIGIVTAVTLPTYRQYTVRARVSEAVLALTTCRGPVQELYLAGGGSLPGADNYGCERTTPSPMVLRLRTTNEGIIVAELSRNVGDARAALQDLTMAPLNRSGTPMNEDDMGTGVFRWRCGSRTDGTTVDERFLPATCRGL